MARSHGKVAGNQGTGILKLLALAMMFCDHAGKMLFSNHTGMRVIGRMAFPLYAWSLVVGSCFTHNMGMYIVRMLITFVVSQPLYMVALNHTWAEPNIFLTLALGLVGIWGMQQKKLLSQVWAPLLAISLAVLLHADYGWKGVLLMLLLWGVRDSRPGIAGVMLPFCLYWGANSSTVNDLFGFSLKWMATTPVISTIMPRATLQTFAVAALPLMLIRMPQKPKLPKWAGYSLYPLHLVALIMMEGQMLPNGWADVAARFNGLVLNPALQLPGNLMQLLHSIM